MIEDRKQGKETFHVLHCLYWAMYVISVFQTTLWVYLILFSFYSWEDRFREVKWLTQGHMEELEFRPQTVTPKLFTYTKLPPWEWKLVFLWSLFFHLPLMIFLKVSSSCHAIHFFLVGFSSHQWKINAMKDIW